MNLFISSLNVPIGYAPPPFPSLYWPLGPLGAKFRQLYLYFSWDMWRFTVFWSLIMFGGLYFVTGTMAALIQIRNRNHRQAKASSSVVHMVKAMPIAKGLLIVFAYTLMGLFQGFAGGAIVGLLIASIYKAGALRMSTWVPFVYALAQVTFDICTSYLLSSVIL